LLRHCLGDRGAMLNLTAGGRGQGLLTEAGGAGTSPSGQDTRTTPAQLYLGFLTPQTHPWH